MARALSLAGQALYTTSPNPRVGCVIVRDGTVVGEGWHVRPGEAHAEVAALEQARGNAAGATVYVTLEPCNHFGRTPPCVNALIDAKVAHVIAASHDPNPIARDGAERLRAAGIAVEFGLMDAEARELNIGFFARHVRGRPWVRLKLAASLDGRTALENGQSQWITHAEARRDGHHFRARSCVVLTGIGTVRDDNPQLTVRDVATTRQPLRVLVDSRFEVALDANILAGGHVLVAGATDHAAKIRALQSIGAEVLVMPNAHGKVELSELLDELGRRGWNEIHIEAGNKLNGSLLREGLIDELVVYLAPSVIGDAGQGMFNLPTLRSLGERVRLTIRDVRMIGPDVRVIARVVR
ncbi:MAG: bifunctional diaminohydroxyphosphoribosylaminopyrimidine deaminase/5-amino-6-(5-phosphoribosylamino)uracil reductase RibD [Betaproteobacteria bacterium]|nr:bifunctional diaminohydroxyphosphoribosylaminopyrimidine deaminase/5-amino-6-(5-phosphoribosylamino)uracil reductase RibD [Betaproteobacteria bacterium]